ncbi:hypothetical protein KY335_03255 [Candidatus Woesearchaeota archaeon]|nr:hypothetical protein [Candidatus Woesearchaeota archaeon]
MKVKDNTYLGQQELVPRIPTHPNTPGIFKIIFNVKPDGTTYFGPIDFYVKFGNHPNACFRKIYTEEIPGAIFEQPLPPCTQQQIVNSVEVTADNVAVDGDLFSFNLNAEFTPPEDCMYTGAGDVTLTTYQIVGPDGVYSMDDKNANGGKLGSDGFVSGGGIRSYFPDGDGAEPGGPVPPLPPDSGEPDKLGISITVDGFIDGIYPFTTPVVITFPIPRITTTGVPTTIIDIPDKDIINYFDIPPGDVPPDYTKIPEPIPNPIPMPDPTPFPDPIPDVIERIFFPGPTGKYLKHYVDTTQLGEVSTDEGKKLDETKAFQLTNGVANGRVEVISPWGGRDTVVRLFLETGGEEVPALRSVILKNKAVPDLKVFTKEALPLGQFTVGGWGSNIALRTNTDGGAFYQMDYNSLKDGQYSLIAVSGNMVKMFYFEIANGQIIFLKVPPKKLIANLKLIARELGVPVSIQRLGEDEVILYYKDQKWNNEAGQQTKIPEDLT